VAPGSRYRGAARVKFSNLLNRSSACIKHLEPSNGQCRTVAYLCFGCATVLART